MQEEFILKENVPPAPKVLFVLRLVNVKTTAISNEDFT